MKRIICIPILALAITALCRCTAVSGSSEDQVKQIFDRMEAALGNSDEPSFQDVWHSEGYANNLVGDSGMDGSRVFSQGSRKGWFLKPDFTKMEKQDSVYIVPCDIWSREKSKSVDFVYTLVVKQNDEWRVLGAGEDQAEVSALADRFLAGASLNPEQSK